MDFEQQKAIKEFCENFSKRVDDTVMSLEMASFEATPAVLNELSLEIRSLGSELWGLLVFCSKNLYFYVHPYESAISMMIRQAAKGKEPKEQLLNLSSLKAISFNKPPKHWYDFLFLAGAGKLTMEYLNEKDEKHYVSVTTQHKADVVLEKINEVLHKGEK